MPRSGHRCTCSKLQVQVSSHCTTPLLAQPIGADPPPDVQPNLRTAPPSRPHRACHRAAYAPHAPLRCARVRAWPSGVRCRCAGCCRERVACSRAHAATAVRTGSSALSATDRRSSGGPEHSNWPEPSSSRGRRWTGSRAGSRKPAAQRGRGWTARESLRRNAAAGGRLEEACGATRPGMAGPSAHSLRAGRRLRRSLGSRKPAAQRGRGWSVSGSLRRNAAAGGRLEEACGATRLGVVASSAQSLPTGRRFRRSLRRTHDLTSRYRAREVVRGRSAPALCAKTPRIPQSRRVSDGP